MPPTTSPKPDGGNPAATPVRTAVRAAADLLAEAGVASPRHDAETLAAHVLGLDRAQLWRVGTLSPSQARAFAELVDRRGRREPLQHLTGRAFFRHVALAVGPGVFVPRPETELVAGAAIGAAREVASGGGRAPLVVDLCTGSGAIALAVADEVPAARVHGVELSADAARWAARNLAGSGVTLHVADIAVALPELDGAVDVVVVNPPYVPLRSDPLEPEVRDHDPALALWSGPDGLEMIAVVERVAARLLRPGGHVVVEHADVQGESAPAVFSRSGRWREVGDHHDLAGRPRYLTATRS